MNQDVLKGMLLDERTELTLAELCEACSTSTEWVIELVEEGVIEPAGGERSRWRFSGTCLQRARTATRLQRDLDVNLAGVALVLDLMDEIQALRERLGRFDLEDRDGPRKAPR